MKNYYPVWVMVLLLPFYQLYAHFKKRRVVIESKMDSKGVEATALLVVRRRRGGLDD